MSSLYKERFHLETHHGGMHWRGIFPCLLNTMAYRNNVYFNWITPLKSWAKFKYLNIPPSLDALYTLYIKTTHLCFPREMNGSIRFIRLHILDSGHKTSISSVEAQILASYKPVQETASGSSVHSGHTWMPTWGFHQQKASDAEVTVSRQIRRLKLLLLLLVLDPLCETVWFLCQKSCGNCTVGQCLQNQPLVHLLAQNKQSNTGWRGWFWNKGNCPEQRACSEKVQPDVLQLLFLFKRRERW